jgi:methyl-accepting chemotaxis protein
MRQMVEKLDGMVGKIRTTSGTVTLAAEELATGNADLSQRTEAQAASLEQTASSMDQLTATVAQNADRARSANRLAIGASDVATKGGNVVRGVVTTMSSITASSRRIADIIGVIDGIAFQTNILALNAAVEAARAGEQGRGFAVVATEVRSLAHRSAEAAREIKDLIGASVAKVEEGSVLVAEAGTTIDAIVHAVRQVTDIMADITTATDEQSAGISQVNQAVVQMDAATQQNAALVEEAAAAAESMQEQAKQLTTTVAAFKLDAHSRQRDPVRAVIARAQSVARTAPATGPVRGSTPARRAAKPAVAASASRPKGNVPVVKAGADDEWAEF